MQITPPTSLANLELLCLGIYKFTQEDLRVLGGMPALETLVLSIGSSSAGPFTIGGSGALIPASQIIASEIEASTTDWCLCLGLCLT